MEPLRLLLAGDVMTGRGIDQVLPHPSAPGLFEPWVRDAREYVRIAEEASGPIPRAVAPESIWGDALPALRQADLRVVNLETAITASDDAWPGKGIHYRMAPANLACLAAAQLDVAVLANNHVLDWGFAGLRETLQVLGQLPVRCAGAGLQRQQAQAPVAVPLAGGGRLLVSAWATGTSGVPAEWAAGATRPGIALLPDLSDAGFLEIARAVASARQPGDLCLVSLHWGGNWGFGVRPEHRAFAHRLVDQGVADVVHGHSSHHPLGIEVHRGRAVLYGCGDLLNDYEGIGPHGSLRSDASCLYLLTLAADGALQRLEIVPLRIRRFRLEQADEATRRWLRELFEREGRALGTGVDALPDGRLALRWG
jgi:poly-gamma-glutamate capsule biosynthesis protein CapA/YwtB (metallophosphatase superfamily)